MPCEACLSQFTIFRRKRSCGNCRRFYCGNCVKERNKGKVLCARCSIFAKRPLLRTELLQLKPKDLIFYLQSKHISTAGCVEKEELVALILHHAQQTDATSPNHSDTGSGFSSPTHDDAATTFDNIKQTCQNFFGNISERYINDSFMAFDGRAATAKNPQNARTHSNRSRSGSNAAAADGGANDNTAGTPTNITTQPRVATREMPTYASSSQQQPQPQQRVTPTATAATTPMIQQLSSTSTSTAPSSNCHSSQTVSPVVSFDSTASPSRTAFHAEGPRAIEGNGVGHMDADGDSDNCECSDDEEFLTNFTTELLPKTATAGASADVNAAHQHETLTIASQVDININALAANAAAQNHIAESDTSNGIRDESLHSSFEELGAIGGISDDSKAATDTNSGNTDQWQMLDGSQRQSDESGDSGETDAPGTSSAAHNASTNVNASICSAATADQSTSTGTATATATMSSQTKKVIRRRSDGYLNRTRRVVLSDDELSPTGNELAVHIRSAAILLEPAAAALDETAPTQRVMALHCRRCGKNKLSIRQHVERMRRHLESSQMSEVDIKRELQAFLSYLEKRTMSMDSDDVPETALVSPIASTASEALAAAAAAADSNFNDSDGIHVYGSNAPSDMDTSRFINLADFDTLDDLEALTVKQLKEVLMLNRIDYKGCCEKQELLERVTRLWHTLKKAPAVEKLPTDELCKICMDAPIECIILECGHMATCTSCGKVLSECPICRQYIVRVVRFFRA